MLRRLKAKPAAAAQDIKPTVPPQGSAAAEPEL